MSKRKNKKSQQAEVVEEEKLLYNAPKVEKVISDSPGLEDDEHPELSPEELERATLAFHTKQDPGGRITREHLKGLFVEMRLKFEGDQYARLVETPHLGAVSFDASDKCDLDAWLALFARVYAPATRYGARLRRAAGRGEVDRMRDYAARGCDARGSDGLGFTALHCAAQHDQGDALAVLLGELLGHGAVDVRDKSGWTPLLCAAANGRAKICEKLVEAGADVGATSVHGRTALHWAAAKGRADCAKFLLKKGADPNLPDGAGMTPVHLAAQHGHLGACTVLLGASDKALGAPNTIGVKPTDYQDVVFWSRVNDALPGAALK